MNLSLQPEIYGTIQPDPVTPTVVPTIVPDRAAQVTVYITNNQTALDKVRLQLRPANVALLPSQFILYDTPIQEGHSVYISQVCVDVGDQIIVYSESGACTFTVSGTAFVYD